MKSPIKYDGEGHTKESDEGPVDFERAIFLTGKGKFNYLLLATLFPICWAITYQSASISYVLPSAECDLQLTLTQQGILNSMTFAGMILSTFVWGFVIDSIGRKNIMLYGFFFMAICTLASSFVQVSWELIVLKLLDGIATSGVYAALQSYLAELHGEFQRPKMYMWMGILFAVGHISLSCLAWLIIPNTWVWKASALFSGQITVGSWRLFLMLSALPSLTASVALCFLPESPRFLISKRRHSDALDVFKKIYTMNTGNEPDTYPVKCLEEEETTEVVGATFKQIVVGSLKQIQPLVMQPYVIVLISTAFIQFGATIGSNTLRQWMPLLFAIMNRSSNSESSSFCEKLGGGLEVDKPHTVDCTNTNVPGSVYKNAIIISVASVIGYVIAKSLVNYIGKRRLMVICFIGAGSSCALLYWAKTEIEILIISSTFVALSSIGGTIVNNVIVDMFPTSLRTMALSITMTIGRVGAVVGNIMFPILFDLSCLGPFIMIGSVCLLCAALTLALPRRKT